MNSTKKTARVAGLLPFTVGAGPPMRKLCPSWESFGSRQKNGQFKSIEKLLIACPWIPSA